MSKRSAQVATTPGQVREPLSVPSAAEAGMLELERSVRIYAAATSFGRALMVQPWLSAISVASFAELVWATLRKWVHICSPIPH